MSFSIVRHVGEDHIVQLLVTKDGVGISGLSPTIEIRRLSDGKYLNHNTSVAPFWTTVGGSKTLPMTEVSWAAGLYKYKFRPTLVDSAKVDDFDFIVINEHPEYAVYKVEHVIYVPRSSQFGILFDNFN